MNESPISWLMGDDGRQGSTWNPTDGCEVCSPGCKNCYAMRMAGRFSGPGKPYEGLVTIGKNKKAVWNGTGRLNVKALARPLHWKRPRKVFVDSMSDLFFDPIAFLEIAAVFGVMALTQQHTHLILTKRGVRMSRWYHEVRNESLPQLFCIDEARRQLPPHERSVVERLLDQADLHSWPLPNVWQGVSVDTRKHGLPRIAELQDIEAAVRWLSIEPLLEDLGTLDLRGIHWVVVGCESGPGARECKPEWIRSIVAQCKEQGVPVFLKQAVETWTVETEDARVTCNTGSFRKGRGHGGPVIEMPFLDGKQYLEFPKTRQEHGHA